MMYCLWTVGKNPARPSQNIVQRTDALGEGMFHSSRVSVLHAKGPGFSLYLKGLPLVKLKCELHKVTKFRTYFVHIVRMSSICWMSAFKCDHCQCQINCLKVQNLDTYFPTFLDICQEMLAVIFGWLLAFSNTSFSFQTFTQIASDWPPPHVYQVPCSICNVTLEM